MSKSKNKPGFKTTEFVVAVAVLLLVSLPQAMGDSNPWVRLAGLIGAALTSAGYGISRALMKSAEKNADAALELHSNQQAEADNGLPGSL